jgi:uncharacterized protein YdiU (UPF0061 family)
MTIASWRFDNSYARLPDAFHVRLGPTPVRAARTVIFNHSLAERLGLHLDGEAASAVLAGNALPEGAEPLAQAYAGHQFGNFTMLGDGRAILLGEHIAPDGMRFDIQLKGAGPTPFSRRGDGRAALGPMLREYLISEAMHGFGIATTRSLAVVATGEPVYREEILDGAVLTRVAASHLRVGTFEFAAAREDVEGLKALTAYAIDRHYPELKVSDNPALALLDAVIVRQAELIAEWMRVGFVHGVMNTDNMTISGETIDYGPCAFLDAYDPMTAFSSIDMRKRYAFANQPPIAQWNLARLAESLIPLLDADEERAVALATERIGSFRQIYEDCYLSMMRRKLGLRGEEAEDAGLITALLGWMAGRGADYTNVFRSLTNGAMPQEGTEDDAFRQWHQAWQARINRQEGGAVSAAEIMDLANPVFIPRNHKVEEALEAATGHGDLEPFRKLLDVLEHPYELRTGFDDLRKPMPVSGGPYRTFCGT